MNLTDFIDICKTLLRDGYIEYIILDGNLVKCTVYEDEHVRIIRSMIDYTTIIIMRSSNKKVLTIDKNGYTSSIDKDWKILYQKIEKRNRILVS